MIRFMDSLCDIRNVTMENSGKAMQLPYIVCMDKYDAYKQGS